MERFKQFQFLVPFVPLEVQFLCVSGQIDRRVQFRFRFRFLKNGSGFSSEEKRRFWQFWFCFEFLEGSQWFQFPALVRFLGYPDEGSGVALQCDAAMLTIDKLDNVSIRVTGRHTCQAQTSRKPANLHRVVTVSFWVLSSDGFSGQRSGVLVEFIRSAQFGFLLRFLRMLPTVPVQFLRHPVSTHVAHLELM